MVWLALYLPGLGGFQLARGSQAGGKDMKATGKYPGSLGLAVSLLHFNTTLERHMWHDFPGCLCTIVSILIDSKIQQRWQTS